MFSAKDPAEIVTVTFDFSALSGTISNATVAATPFRGVDPSASAILSGSAQISGARVLQKITGGLNGVIYDLKCQVDAPDGSRYVLSDKLPVVKV